MSTKWKIIAGFVVMVIITGVVVFLGYTGIQRSSEGFIEYRRLARLNVATSELEVSLDTAAGNMYAYISSKDEKYVSDAKNSVKKFAALLSENENVIQNPETKELFASLHTEIKAFETIIDRVPQNTVSNDKQYRDVVVVAAWAIIDHLKKMTQVAEGTGNSTALAAISGVWADMTQFMSGISRYANRHTKEDADIVAGYINRMNASLATLDKTLPSEAGRQDIAILKSHYTNLNNAFKNMVELSTILKDDLVAMDSFIAETIIKVRKLSSNINDQMQAFGTATLKSNNDAQKYMLVAGSISLILGIIIALVIVVGIIKVLREMVAFAGAVSKGDFDYQIKIREKGEIGEMIQAMSAIPDVLGRIIVTINDIANNIRKGRLRERLDTSTLPGSFLNLGVAINAVNDSYTGLIDALPLPVIACDKELHIIFANASGKTVLGGEHLSMPCGDLIGAAECNSEQCLGKKAISGKSSITAETTIHPQNKRMDVSVTVIPVFDMSGEASGFVEIITDLTEIKKKQTAMLKVTQDASSIADRVAAASEQIAAQVEQISRGAEIQRERVETTASAMSQMNATVLEVARNAGQASERSEGTRHMAVEGAQLVDKVVGAIHKVNEVGQKLHGNMQELGHQAENIGGVMNVISDIADQTNLLALNAAIEAARAGEAGRGFAVVADEVRKLAEKTMEATKEVGSNISAIQHSTKINQEEVNNAVNSVGEATELANASGKALKEIVTLATDNSSVVTSIATAAEEQSAASEEINSSIDEISRITSETTDGMVQSSAAVQELSHMAQELRRVMEGLR